MPNKKIVITGIGAVTPIGNSVDEFWQALLDGKSGADSITIFDTEKFATKFACEIKNLNLEDYLDRKSINRMDRFSHFGIISSEMAIKDSGLNLQDIDLARIGVIFGSGIGGMQTYYNQFMKYFETGRPDRVSPFLIPMFIPDMAAGMIAMRNGLRGPNYATVSACSSSLHAIMDAYMIINAGYADFVICGGAEAAISPLAIAGFNSARALSTRNDDPKTASRPYDVGRNGFVMGEGAGAFLLETYESAKARNAHIYGEISGIAASCDAYHMTAPHPEGLGAIAAMKNALEYADLEPRDIDYINTHGTSTPLGDVAEVKGIKEVFGSALQNINLSSTKSMMGHLLGAAGIVESIACVLAMKNQIVPPTINIFEQDENIDVNVTPNKPVKRKVEAILNNGFGFGGHNASLVIKKV